MVTWLCLHYMYHGIELKGIALKIFCVRDSQFGYQTLKICFDNLSDQYWSCGEMLCSNVMMCCHHA